MKRLLGTVSWFALSVLLLPDNAYAADRGAKTRPSAATVAAADRVWRAVAGAARFWSQYDRPAAKNRLGLTRTTTDNITYEALSPGRKQVGRVTASIGEGAHLMLTVSYGTRAAEAQLLRLTMQGKAGRVDASFNGKTVRVRAGDGDEATMIPVNTYAGRERIAHVRDSLPSYAIFLGDKLPTSVLVPVQALIDRVPRRDRDVFESMLAPFLNTK
jgi:hypothetical protein